MQLEEREFEGEEGGPRREPARSAAHGTAEALARCRGGRPRLVEGPVPHTRNYGDGAVDAPPSLRHVAASPPRNPSSKPAPHPTDFTACV